RGEGSAGFSTCSIGGILAGGRRGLKIEGRAGKRNEKTARRRRAFRQAAPSACRFALAPPFFRPHLPASPLACAAAAAHNTTVPDPSRRTLMRCAAPLALALLAAGGAAQPPAPD